ncbi:MAG: hypothetical protein P4L46_26525 [Fimbriimonas sp.]|nr:hypothetical protein [Fimbriimonas sp.]
MSIPAPLNGEMRDLMAKAVRSRSGEKVEPVVSAVASILRGAEEGLRTEGLPDAVLELRLGWQSNLGMRYPAFLRNERNTFEQPLFSIYVNGSELAFQAEGSVFENLQEKDLLDKVSEYLLRDYVVEFMTGLLRQFQAQIAHP